MKYEFIIAIALAIAFTVGARGILASSALSPNATVDTRNITPGTLSIAGPTTVAHLGEASYQAWHDGQDVTGQCIWNVDTARVFTGWYQYPTNSAGVLDPGHFEVGDALTVTATLSLPAGTRQAAAVITVVEGSGLNFAAFTDVTYMGPQGPQFEWRLEAFVSGLAVDQPGVTFSWALEGEPGRSGETAEWTAIIGQPSLRRLTVTADDGMGNTEERVVWISLPAPAPGEPGQRYYDTWAKGGYVFLGSDGDLYTPVPGRIGTGLIVLTHGLSGSPYDQWLTDLAEAIESRLTGEGMPLPNIVIFGWRDDAQPAQLEGTAKERLETVARYAQFSELTLDTLLARYPGAADFLYNISVIKPVAARVGRSILSEWLRQEEALGNISMTVPIHLIGHSAGGFVVGECYYRNRHFNIQRVTMLDTPLPYPNHVNGGDPAVIERYVSSFFGQVAQGIDHRPRTSGPFGFAVAGVYASPKPDSAFYHRRDVGTFFSHLPTVNAHQESYRWYIRSAEGEESGEGFDLSPVLAAGAGASAPLMGRSSTDGGATLLGGGGEMEAAGAPLGDFQTFGSVAGTAPYVLTEAGNAGIFNEVILPPDADQLQFQFQFTAGGDGDVLAVYLADDPPLFLYGAPAAPQPAAEAAEISVAAYAGQTVTLVIKLAALNAANAVVEIDEIEITTDPDIDGDGILVGDELAMGTSPMLADTDGDGLDDDVEVTTSLTDPTVPDTDGDGMNDGSEVGAATDPGDPMSLLWISAVDLDGSGLTIEWPTAPGKTYRVIRSPDLQFGSNFDVLGFGLPAGAPSQTFVDDTAPGQERQYYRVELEP